MSDGILGRNISVKLLELLSHDYVKSWTQPIHCPVDSVLNTRVPSVVEGLQVFVIENIENRIGILVTFELRFLSISKPEQKITCSCSINQKIGSVIHRFWKLKQIP